MMKKTTFLALAFVASNLLAQQKAGSIGFIRSSNIYATALGDVTLFSINFEKLYVINPGFFVAGKIGVGFTKEINFSFWGYDPPDNYFTTLPHHISLNFGHRRSFFEVGMGGDFVLFRPTHEYYADNTYDTYYYLYPFVGYRFQNMHSNKLVFRAFVSYPLTEYFPRLTFFANGFMFFPIGLSLGWVL